MIIILRLLMGLYHRIMFLSNKQMTNMGAGTDPDDVESGLYFCYRIIYFYSMTYIAIFFCVLCLILLVYAIYKFTLIEKIGVSKQVRITYVLIILWGLFYLSKLILADATFFVYEPHPNNQRLSIISKYLFSLDISSVFILQTALVLIPYNWMVRIIDIFTQLTNYEQKSTSTRRQSSLFKFQKRCCIVFKGYLYIRVCYVVFIAVFCAVRNQTIQTVIATILLITLLSETAVLFIMLSLGLYSLKNNEKAEDLLDDAQLNTMKNQYKILIASTLMRLLNNGWYVYQNLRELGSSKNCQFDPGSDERYPYQYQAILLFVFEAFITHLLPIYVVLRIYRIKKSTIELSESLIIEPEKSPQQ